MELTVKKVAILITILFLNFTSYSMLEPDDWYEESLEQLPQLQKKSEPDTQKVVDQNLQEAIVRGDIKGVKKALRNGANPDNSSKNTPLSLAIECALLKNDEDRFQVVRSLLRHGANANAPDALNKTPLTILDSSEVNEANKDIRSSIFEILCRYGAQYNDN